MTVFLQGSEESFSEDSFEGKVVIFSCCAPLAFILFLLSRTSLFVAVRPRRQVVVSFSGLYLDL